jgi:hypothetical protein
MSTNEVMLASFYAMLRVFLTSSVGVFIASYPAGNVIFPPSCMQQISRVSNFVFLPFLIVYSMASALTLPLLLKGSVLILFSIISGLVPLTPLLPLCFRVCQPLFYRFAIPHDAHLTPHKPTHRYLSHLR